MKLNLGAVVEGKSSLAYKTGNWRDQKPLLHVDRCKACGQCEEVCPDNAVHIINEVYVIDYGFCKGCGLCAYECPAQAIEMILEEK